MAKVNILDVRSDACPATVAIVQGNFTMHKNTGTRAWATSCDHWKSPTGVGSIKKKHHIASSHGSCEKFLKIDKFHALIYTN